MLKNYSEEVDLISYCLMPNHFHLLVYQSEKFSINYFMRSLATKYSMFFNKKYERVGCVFQGVYKGVRVDSEEQLVYLSKYIHRNPVEILPAGRVLVGFKYSSYPNYLGLINQIWVKPKAVLSYFTRENKIISYQNFVEEVGENYKAVNKFLIDQEPAGRVLAG